MKTILITGGSGLVGRALSQLLISKGYKVVWLSRERFVKAEIPRYSWDYNKGTIDEDALLQADIIVHLAGSNLGEGAWTRKKKQEIVESRVKTAQLILNTLKRLNKKPDAFISASAVGYYGKQTSDTVFDENTPSGKHDFLSRTCRKWESAAHQFYQQLGVRVVCFRTGLVLAPNSEAMRRMLLPARYGLAAPLGDGSQFLSWIHIDDLCSMYLKAVEDTSMQGIYNAVAPSYTTNAQFMRALAKSIQKPFFFPKIPAFILRLVLGEAADMMLSGSRVSAQKILDSGFEFNHPEIYEAMTAVVSEM